MEKSVNLKKLKKDFRQIGVNFFSARVVGVFVNHFVGIGFWPMLITSLSLLGIGSIILYIGVKK